LQHWSAALSSELSGTGVDVELVLSYLVVSAMSKVRKPTALIPRPRPFVKNVLNKIGRSGGAQNFAATRTPYWSHALLQWWVENTVGIGSSIGLAINKKMHMDIRIRASKKAEREAKKA
jgi:17beta-estradiol 17-dehydrogenase / very-long-chain 3-oxoacyl-CoA reductase